MEHLLRLPDVSSLDAFHLSLLLVNLDGSVVQRCLLRLLRRELGEDRLFKLGLCERLLTGFQGGTHV